MAVDIGFVAEIAWMPRLYDTALRDKFDDGEQVSLETVGKVVEDYCDDTHTEEERQAAREFYAGCERLWNRHGWDPTTTAPVVFGAARRA